MGVEEELMSFSILRTNLVSCVSPCWSEGRVKTIDTENLKDSEWLIACKMPQCSLTPSIPVLV